MLENINMRIIQKYLGHAKIDTAEFYTHIDLSGLRDAGNVIDVTMQNYIIDCNKEIINLMRRMIGPLTGNRSLPVA